MFFYLFFLFIGLFSSFFFLFFCFFFIFFELFACINLCLLGGCNGVYTGLAYKFSLQLLLFQHLTLLVGREPKGYLNRVGGGLSVDPFTIAAVDNRCDGGKHAKC